MAAESGNPTIVVGAGLSGIATALRLADLGRPSIVLERAENVGGASAYSAGQVWIPANHKMEEADILDSVEEGRAYVSALAAHAPEFLDEAAMDRWLETAPLAARYFEELGAARWAIIPGYPDYFHPATPGSKEAGRYLSSVFDGSRLGEWRERLNVTPHFPMGTSYAELFGGEDEPSASSAFGSTAEGSAPADTDKLTFGTGVYAGFLARALEEELIEIRTESRVTELRREGEAVIGVEVDGPDGLFSLDGPVVLATSGFDWDPRMVERFWGLDPENFGSIAPRSIAGDGIRLAEEAGAEVVEMPNDHIPMVPGYPDPTGRVSHRAAMEHCMPHTFIVNSAGKRFCSDDMYWELVAAAMGSPTELPFFMVWDEQHHAKYGLGDTAPGGEYPAELVSTGATLEELGAALGIDGAGLAATAANFNTGAEESKDPEFGRGTNSTWRKFAGDPSMPNPNYGPVSKPPYFGMRVVITGNAIGMSGVRADAEGHALSAAGDPIPGLHVVGSAAAFTTSGTGYNSGYALSRAITHGYLVGAELAAAAGAAASEG